MSTEPAIQAGPDVEVGHVTFRFPDPQRRLRAVRLYQEVNVSGDRLGLVWEDGLWQLSLELPVVDRVEYLFELTRADGSSESVTDPANPRQVAGAFGDKSVVELPGYCPPRWLGQPAPEGRRQAVTVPSRELDENIVATIWSPDGVEDAEELPLLLVHDGPEYDELAAAARTS